MLKKMALAASAAVVVLGAGTAALATSTSAPTKPSTPGTSSAPTEPGTSNAPAKPGNPAKPGTSGAAPGAAAPDRAARGPKARKLALKALGRALHAQWVTPDGDSENTFVTHNAIRGEVTAVSATSITVKALDGVTQTYAITGDTKVHLRKGLPSLGNGKGNGARGNRGGLGNGPAGTISDVRTGDQVAVTGTGTTSLTAQHVVDATP